MRFYPYYEQKNTEVVRQYLKSSTHGSLLTSSASGQIHSGVFNPYVLEKSESAPIVGQKLFLHLQIDDEQLSDLRLQPECLFVMTDFLALIPSHWVDAKYGGAATSYYRYLELRCSSRILSAHELVEGLKKMLKSYQPEGGYEALAAESRLYQPSFAQLAGVELEVLSMRTKWKLGQNRPAEIRQKIAAHLFRRGAPNDLVAAQLIEDDLVDETSR